MLPRDPSSTPQRSPPPKLDLEVSTHTGLVGANGDASTSGFGATHSNPNPTAYPGSAPWSSRPSEDSDRRSDESEDVVRDAIGQEDERGIEETLERLGFGECSSLTSGFWETATSKTAGPEGS